MRRLTKLFFSGAAAFLAIATLSTAASAQGGARVVADLNMRTGPSTAFPVITVLPANAIVSVFGCAQGSNWCNVAWNGASGWAYASYLTGPSVASVTIANPAVTVEVPVVNLTVGTVAAGGPYAYQPNVAAQPNFVYQPNRRRTRARVAGQVYVDPFGPLPNNSVGLLAGSRLVGVPGERGYRYYNGRRWR